MAPSSNPDTSNLYNILSKLYEDGNDLLVSYKRMSKIFSDIKKNLANPHENLEKAKKNINKEIKYYLDSLEEVHKRKNYNVGSRNKAIYEKKVIDQLELLRAELAAIDKRMKTEKNISKVYLLDHEKVFLKSKKVLRVRKIDLLDKINKIKLLLRKKLKEKFEGYIISNFDSRVFGNDPNYKNNGKCIIKFLKAGEISERAAKKSKQINDLKTLENVSDRKTQMEIQIEMVKLESVVKKKNEYKNLLIDKIKKIIDKESDSDMKRKLFRLVTRQKRNKKFEVITNNKGNPVEEKVVDIRPNAFEEFLDSGNTYPKYKNEIDKYNLKVEKLENKQKMILRKIDKLKEK
jgi:hypothetical protein